MPGVKEAMLLCGAYFNANDVLEYTCTANTQPAIENALEKLQFLGRPLDVPRSMVAGQDRKGQTYRSLDGSNISETAGGELEKPLPANAGYSKDVFQGKLMGKASRYNERVRCSLHGGVSLGHYDMRLARQFKMQMLKRGAPDPHPSLSLLAPHTDAKYGVDYFDEEQQRKRQRSDAGSSSTEPSAAQFALNGRTAAAATSSTFNAEALAAAITSAVPAATCDAATIAASAAAAAGFAAAPPAASPAAQQPGGLVTAVSIGSDMPDMPSPALSMPIDAERCLAAHRESQLLIASRPTFESQTAAVLLREPGLSAADLSRRPDRRPPAAKKVTLSASPSSAHAAEDDSDIPGIMSHHATYGKGRAYQMNYPLDHPRASRPKLCTCRPSHEKGKLKGGHMVGCEHAIIKAYLKAHNLKAK